MAENPLAPFSFGASGVSLAAMTRLPESPLPMSLPVSLRGLVPAVLLALGLWAQAPAAAADCQGQDLIAALPAAESAALRARAGAEPFAEGNLWTATRGAAQITLVGTYHLDDPRHAETLARLAPLVGAASALLVEAGPEEEKALMARVAADPSTMFITEGPTLLERLPAATWNRLSRALSERGIPGFMAAKFQPWYATVILAIPPCAMANMAEPKGLDGMLIDTATAAGVPIKALEPYDTVFKLFGDMTEAQQIAMVDSSLATEDQAEDFAATLVAAYFRGESRLVWEMMRKMAHDAPGADPAEVDAEFAVMEKALMEDRNRAWIPVIDAASAEGPLVVAFGALHLSGRAGVLNLLAEDGWVLAPLR